MRATLQVSAVAFEEIKKRLELCGWAQACLKTYTDVEHPQPIEVIDFGEVGLIRETDEKVTVFIVYESKLVKGSKA